MAINPQGHFAARMVWLLWLLSTGTLLGGGTAQEQPRGWRGAVCLFWAVTGFSPVGVSCSVSGGLEKILSSIFTSIDYFLRSAL